MNQTVNAVAHGITWEVGYTTGFYKDDFEVISIRPIDGASRGPDMLAFLSALPSIRREYADGAICPQSIAIDVGIVDDITDAAQAAIRADREEGSKPELEFGTPEPIRPTAERGEAI